MKSYFARQPIFSKRKNIIAYEILYRESIENKFPSSTSGEKATSSLLINSFFNIDIFSVVNHKPIFINFPSVKSLERLVNFIPVKNVYIEILENLTPSDELYNVMKSLFHKGYRFVLDDFIYSKEWNRFLKFIKIIKIDILDTPENKIPALLKLAKTKKIKTIAEKIETYEQFKNCKKLGFDYFQGFFFAKPEVVEKNIDPSKNSTLLILYRELLRKELNYDKIASAMYTDSSIAFKFFQYVSLISKGKKLSNNKNKSIDSIKSAIAYIGENNVRDFIFLLTTANISIDKPLELQKLSVTRAKFAQSIAKRSDLKNKSEGASLVGLFSCLDAMLDADMKAIIKDINIDDDIKSALLNKNNEYSNIINIFKSYETGNWQKVDIYLDKINFNGNIDSIYSDSVIWTERHFQTS